MMIEVGTTTWNNANISICVGNWKEVGKLQSNVTKIKGEQMIVIAPIPITINDQIMASSSLAERHASTCQFPAFAFHRQDSGSSPRQPIDSTRINSASRKKTFVARKNGLLSSSAEVVRHVRDEFRAVLYFPLAKKPPFKDSNQIYERMFPLIDYIPLQPFLDRKSRGKVVCWMIQLASVEECSVLEIHLSVSIFDRFLAIRAIKNVPFVALSCSILAIKSSRSKCADQAAERIAFCAGFPIRESAAMAGVVSTALTALSKIDVSDVIHIQSFLDGMYCKVCHCDGVMRDLANYLAECMLPEYQGMISFYPSELAATALLVARRSLRSKFIGTPWNRLLERHTSYSERRLEPCVQWLHSVMANQPTAGTIVVKYSRMQYHEVAKIKLIFR